MNKASSVIIHKEFIFISYVNLSIYIKQIIKNDLFINYKFENVKFINMIYKKNKDNESSRQKIKR